MSRVTGLYINDHFARMVELRGSPKSLRLGGHSEVPLGKNGDDRGSLIAAAFKAHRLARDPSVLVLPTSWMRVRRITVPFRSEDQIRRVLKTMVEEHIPGMAIEDILADYHKTGEIDDEKSTLLALVLGKDRLRGLLPDLQHAGLDPQVIGNDLEALFNLGLAADAFPEQGTAVTIDLEPHRTGVIVVRDRVLTTMRTFRRRLIKPVTLPSENGDDPPPPDDGKPDLDMEAVEGLALEVLRTILAEGADQEVATSFVTGSLCESPELVADLSGRLALDLPPLPRPSGLDGLAPGHEIPAGAALKMMGHDSLGLDFRTEEFGFRRKFERIKGGLVVLSLLAFLFFTAMGIHFDRRFKTVHNRRKAIAREAIAHYRTALSKDQTLPKKMPLDTLTKTLHDKLKKKLDDLTGQGVDRDVPTIPSALSRWRNLADRINSATGVKYLTVDRFVLEPRVFLMEGLVDSPAALDSLINVIRSAPGFEETRLSRPPKLEDEYYRFGIRSDIKEAEEKK